MSYVLTYEPGQRNRCPGCTGLAWHVGVMMAECARCGFAIPMLAGRTGAGTHHQPRRDAGLAA